MNTNNEILEKLQAACPVIDKQAAKEALDDFIKNKNEMPVDAVYFEAADAAHALKMILTSFEKDNNTNWRDMLDDSIFI
ncbi:hypothetical protein QUF75_02035 [Desulfococcaceae bacterium HSG7]|nr:hypothetical protein [Desulfococcaceae bacterium HSG7]